jgi:hypothetical protein
MGYITQTTHDDCRVVKSNGTCMVDKNSDGKNNKIMILSNSITHLISL